MQLARQQMALLRYGGFLLQRIEAQILHGAGQVAAQRLEQRALGRRQRDAGVVEQIDFAHQVIVLVDRHVDHGLKAGLGAVL